MRIVTTGTTSRTELGTPDQDAKEKGNQKYVTEEEEVAGQRKLHIEELHQCY
jgi:hypothetical protein